LALIGADRELAAREHSFQEALKGLEVKDQEIKELEQRLERSRQRRSRNIPSLEESLQALREEPGEFKEELLSASKVRRVHRMLLSERLFFERLKLQRDLFWLELAQALGGLKRGRAPSQGFLEKQHLILEAAEQERREDDLQTRCEGWRRAQNSVRTKKESGFYELRRELLEHYEALADLCMREEWVLGTQSRLGEIARFHLERYERETRGIGYYLWRGLLSALMGLLILIISRWFSGFTRRLAGRKAEERELKQDSILSDAPAEAEAEAQHLRTQRREQLKRLRSLGSLLLYLSGLSSLWLGSALLAARYIWSIPISLTTLIDWIEHPLFILGAQSVSLLSIISVIWWILFSVWIAGAINSFILDLLEHFAIEPGVQNTIGTITRYIIILTGTALGLSAAGISMEALAMIFGVIGIGIGFGLQNIASNFISGFIILLERPIRKGDFIQVGEMVGEVKKISARATTIETRNAVTVIVPNAEFISNEVINWTLGSGERVRAQVQVGVAYGSDLTQVRRCLLRVARKHRDVLKWPRPWVEMGGFGDSSLDFQLHIWTERIRELPQLLSELNQGVDEAFREAGIEIPFPQRVYHIEAED